ncbi:hypothetical protein B0H13DRAFT_2581852 [Mycena leptocephala]|nr:hypothetical protein B0H13DRAFT_2581852 [Mycena leptocephala]
MDSDSDDEPKSKPTPKPTNLKRMVVVDLGFEDWEKITERFVCLPPRAVCLLAAQGSADSESENTKVVGGGLRAPVGSGLRRGAQATLLVGFVTNRLEKGCLIASRWDHTYPNSARARSSRLIVNRAFEVPIHSVDTLGDWESAFHAAIVIPKPKFEENSKRKRTDSECVSGTQKDCLNVRHLHCASESPPRESALFHAVIPKRQFESEEKEKEKEKTVDSEKVGSTTVVLIEEELGVPLCAKPPKIGES